MRNSRLGLLFLGLVLSTSVMAGPVRLLAFQVNGLAVLPDVGDKHYSVQGAWIPGVDLGGVGLRGELGATPLKNVLGNTFWQINYEGFLTIPLIPALLTLEGGGGLATVTGTGGTTKPILSGYLVVSVPGVLNRVYFGFSHLFVSGNPLNQLKLGLGFSL